MSDVERVWARILEVAARRERVRLKSGKEKTFTRQGGGSVSPDGVRAPGVSRTQIERALAKHPLGEWPLLPVGEVDDMGNTAYVWALLRHVAQSPHAPDDAVRGGAGEDALRTVAQLAQEKVRVETALNEAIRRAAEDDHPLREIGRAAGLTTQEAARIIAG